jgi:hypothetical protein
MGTAISPARGQPQPQGPCGGETTAFQASVPTSAASMTPAGMPVAEALSMAPAGITPDGTPPVPAGIAPLGMPSDPAAPMPPVGIPPCACDDAAAEPFMSGTGISLPEVATIAPMGMSYP